VRRNVSFIVAMKFVSQNYNLKTVQIFTKTVLTNHELLITFAADQQTEAWTLKTAYLKRSATPHWYD